MNLNLKRQGWGREGNYISHKTGKERGNSNIKIAFFLADNKMEIEVTILGALCGTLNWE